MSELGKIAEKTAKVLSCRHAADGAGEDVIKHQRGNAEFREGPAKGLLHRAVNAATHEHAAAFDVNCADSIRKQHDGENEPGRGLADVTFRFATGVIGGGSQVV